MSGRVTIADLSLSRVLHVVKNMRQSDWVEVSNLVPRRLCSIDGIAMLTMQTTGVGFVAELDGIPVAVLQFAERHEGCWSAGLFATDDFPKVWRTVLKAGRDVALPTMLDLGARYCEAHVMADNVPAQRMLEFIGFRRKSEVLTNYGAFGKDFVIFATTREELSDVFLPAENP